MTAARSANAFRQSFWRVKTLGAAGGGPPPRGSMRIASA
jgi:hypothetical protein